MKRVFLLLVFACIYTDLFATANDKIFREYDIRGIVGKEFEVEDTYEMVGAILSYLVEKNPELKIIAVGADGRLHSPAIKQEVCRSILERGFDVFDIGTCTTPTLSFTMYTMPVDAGLMITASHNPGEYNGIKIRLGKESVSSRAMKKICHYYVNKIFLPPSTNQGRIHKIDAIESYTNCLVSLFPHLVGLKIHAIVDCGNGAAGTVMPLLVQKMKWEYVELLYSEVDGTYPNHIADPTVEAYMSDLKLAVIASGADLGIGFDGDADRMAPVTNKGRLLKGDQLLTLYSQKTLREFPGTAIVFDVSSSKSLFPLIEKMGGVPVLAATGIAKVKKQMNESGALLAGEMSCHTIFKDHFFGFDDGIYSMMRLFELLNGTSSSLNDLLDEFPPTFISRLYRIPCERSVSLAIVEKLTKKFALRNDCELITVDGLRVHLPNGWAIVRASNTEPVISIRFEGNSPEELDAIKQEFYPTIADYIKCSEIIQ